MRECRQWACRYTGGVCTRVEGRVDFYPRVLTRRDAVESMARVAMKGTAAAEPAADGAGAQAPATVMLPGMRSGDARTLE